MSFLDLPRPLRLRIYREAGLLGRDVDLYPPNDIAWPWAPPFLGLLLSCKAIHHEVLPVIYTSNNFLLRYRDFGSLAPLTLLSPNGCSFLTSLTLRLNVSACDLDQGCGRSSVKPNPQFPSAKDIVLGKTSSNDRNILSKWKRAAAVLASRIRPQQLTIYFTCDTNDRLTAEEVVGPLLQMPTLRSCALRLGRDRELDICRLAEDTVLRVTGLPPTNRHTSAFPFASLPKELRLHILQLTNLVAPYRIRWNDKRFHLQRLVRGCHDATGCFCRLFHAAFSIPERCNCWQPPTALFLVNHAFRQDALEVFYSKNRFIVDPAELVFEDNEWIWKPTHSIPENLAASQFLREFVPQFAVRYIRYLELSFAVFDADDISPTSVNFKTWKSTISFLADHANLPSLKLMIIMWRADTSRLNRQEALDFTRRYLRILSPLKLLKGLGDLFLDLEYPLGAWAYRTRPTIERNMEAIFEKRFMGESYDSSTRGKDRWPGGAGGDWEEEDAYGLVSTH